MNNNIRVVVTSHDYSSQFDMPSETTIEECVKQLFPMYDSSYRILVNGLLVGDINQKIESYKCTGSSQYIVYISICTTEGILWQKLDYLASCIGRKYKVPNDYAETLLEAKSYFDSLI